MTTVRLGSVMNLVMVMLPQKVSILITTWLALVHQEVSVLGYIQKEIIIIMLEIHYPDIANMTPYPNKVLGEKHTHM